MNSNVKGQDLSLFTVKICDGKGDNVVGTGFIVSPEGHIVTCQHVVREAGVDPRTRKRIPSRWDLTWGRFFGQKHEELPAEIVVEFPPVDELGRTREKRRATVKACFEEYEDDVVLLELKDRMQILDNKQIAWLGRARSSKGHRFESYGFRHVGAYDGLLAYGRIVSYAGKPVNKILYGRPVMLHSQDISGGMSGGAVLDLNLNLVVGVVVEESTATRGADRDTAFAVDGDVLGVEPLALSIRDEPLLREEPKAPISPVDPAKVAVSDPGDIWHGAPELLEEWVDREKLLETIDATWSDPERRVNGLTGFGGAGKSSLARHWVHTLREPRRPNGVFWWRFETEASVDEFFEAALDYTTHGRVNPLEYPSAHARAEILSDILRANRYLFVLDGLEVLQQPRGDQYGRLRNPELRDFLRYFATQYHESFCLITSRAPMIDLHSYHITYAHHEVDRLSSAEGRALLRKLGVAGPDTAVDRVVADWDGHALTLSLLGAYLLRHHGGDVTRIGEIPAPTSDEPLYERVRRILRSYDEHLTDAERAFLMVFSAFRTPVGETTFEQVFRAKMGDDSLTVSIEALDDAAFAELRIRLRDYRILRYNPDVHLYTTHPLIRDYYYNRLTATVHAKSVHERLKEYYLTVVGELPRVPTLSDLSPLIEAVYHACRAGAYDEGCRLYIGRIETEEKVLSYKLSAYDTVSALLQDFFPERDTSREPQLSDPEDSWYVLNRYGVSLMNLGRLEEARSFFERAVAVAMDNSNSEGLSISYQNLVEIYSYLGPITASVTTARQALEFARQIDDQEERLEHERDCLGYLGLAAHLRGETEVAYKAFRDAEKLEREINPERPHLSGTGGIWYGDHLRQTGNTELARRLTEANLRTSELEHWLDVVSMCHRLLGDLDTDANQQESARQHYDEALRIVRGLAEHAVLFEALFARGSLYARRGEVKAALSDLEGALGYCLAGGYRTYQADVRVGLAWAYRAAENVSAAREQAIEAEHISVETEYYWGQIEAKELLRTLA